MKKLEWVKTSKQKPRAGRPIIGAILNRYMNAPWEYSYFELESRDSDHWGDYEEPDYWAYIPAPAMPRSRARKRAIAASKKEGRYRAAREKLDREFERSIA